MATTASTSSLPPKPSAEVSQDFSPSSPSSSDTLNPSTTSSPLCAICASNPSRYTCPRCSLRTCSLPCSTAHKTLGEGCSGIRNKAAYVPMNQYGYMALMNDYAFLEEIERKVTEAGREIVQGGYQNPAPNGTAAFAMNSERGRGRGRGRGGRGMGGRHQQRTGNTSKRDMLRSELDFRDIEMDMLPVGMEKRTLNQSTWDSTMNTALLTVEFVFHPPRNPYAPSSQAPDPPVTLLTHRNRLDEPLSRCLQSRISERLKAKKEKHFIPQWVVDLTTPDPSDPQEFQAPTCVMPTLLDPLVSLQKRSTLLRPGHITRRGYYKLSFDETLQKVLRHKQFVEYPIIEVWEMDAFTGTLVDDGGSVVHEDEDERKPKRRKLGAKEGKKAISRLLGDYGSEDEDGGDDVQEEKNVLGLLAGYAGSDEEGEAHDIQEQTHPLPPTTSSSLPPYLDDDELGDEDAEGETDDEMGEEVNSEELAEMLENLRKAGALRDTSGDGRLAVGTVEEEEQVDWGDSEDDG